MSTKCSSYVSERLFIELISILGKIASSNNAVKSDDIINNGSVVAENISKRLD